MTSFVNSKNNEIKTFVCEILGMQARKYDNSSIEIVGSD